jgi:DNA replication protein DnaC
MDNERVPHLHDHGQCVAGSCGTGKSHLAQALGHAAARQGHDVLFSTQSQLLASLRNAAAVGTYDRRFQYLARLPLLIIDDFGLKPLRSPDDEDFHDLIAERYERAATILTSNLLRGAPRNRFNARSIFMRGPFRRGPPVLQV